MRRTVLVPVAVAAALRARHTIVAVSLAALLALALTLAAPVDAQEETTSQATNGTQAVSKDKDASGQREQSVQGSGQQAADETQADDERAADPLQGQTANITADSIGPIAVAGCEAVAGETARITIADIRGANERKIFTGNEDVAFQFGQQDITIAAEGDGTDLTANFDAVTGEVVDSEGIVCEGGGQRAADDKEADPTEADPAEGSARTADDLLSLSCTELLVLFRAESGSGRQYGDAAIFADSEVRAQVEVCLKKEIVNGPGGDLPNTGGVSLLALAVLGVVSAAAGLSVVRGSRR